MRYWNEYKASMNVRKDFRDIFVRSSNRYASLDGARALTILLMVLFHVLFGVVTLLKKNASAEPFIENFPQWLNWLWHAQGSDPLFVMCGLLVSLSFFKEFDSRQHIDTFRFYMRRFARLLPLFYLALIIYLPTKNNGWEHLLSNLFFASYYFEGQSTIVPVGWSLDLQMQFYLMLPLFYIYVFYKTPHKVPLIVAMIIAAVAWRMWVTWDSEVYTRPFYDAYYDKSHARALADTLYYGLDMRIGGFFMGMLVAVLYYFHKETISDFLSRHAFLNFLILGIALACIYFSVSVPYHNKAADFYQDFSTDWNFIFLSLTRYTYSWGIAMLVFIVLIPSGPSKVFEAIFGAKIFYPFAQLIYPIYLFHFPFMVVAAVIVMGTTDRYSIVSVAPWQVFAVFGLTALFTCAFAIVLNVFIEKPIIRMVDGKYP